MKRSSRISLAAALLIALISLVVAVPTLAVEPREAAPTENNQPFLMTSEEDDDVARVQFGQNLLYAGNNVTNSASANGLLFSFGNRIDVRGNGEYGIAAANILEIHGTTQKDLFAAGNLISLVEGVEVGRDVYLAGNEVQIESDLSGNVAIAASKVTFKNATIVGDVNLSVAQVVFGENVSILGTLVYNDDAEVLGLDNAEIANVKPYATAKREASAAELWTAQAIEVVGTFIVALVLIIVFPRLKDRIAAESTTQRFGADFLGGLGFLALAPILSILLMISVFGVKAGLLILAVWFLVVCLTGVFTGLWLGHLIVEKLFRSHIPFAIEAAIGILILGCCALVPGLDTLVSFFSVVFGTGLMIACIRPPKAETATPDQPAKPLENPFRGQSAKMATKSSDKSTKKTNAKKSIAQSSLTKTAKSGATKSTKPTRKTAQKK